MDARSFSIRLVAIVALFVAINAATWLLFTRDLLTRDADIVSGDLARLGYISDLRQPRRTIADLPRRHLEGADYQGQPVDLLTVGDSFSQGGAGGPNPYYQDFIASKMGWTVLNLGQDSESGGYAETIAMLANSGFLQKAGVRYVLLEATQRKAVSRLARSINLDASRELKDVESLYRIGRGEAQGFNFTLPSVGFINDGNFKLLAYKLLYPINDCAFISVTCRVQLDARRFSIGDGHEMLFYKKDTRTISSHTPANVQRLNANLNALAAKLKAIGIQLLFMPAVSKFDLYRPDFVDASYPKDPFFDLLRTQQREYLLVDTKQILRAGVDAGGIDIFYVDDTHWGPRASALIAEQMGQLVSE